MPPQPHLELLNLPGELEPPSQFQCLECGALLVTPGQLLEHQELHLKLLSSPGDPPKPAPSSGGIHFECPECHALFQSQDLWLAHRQSHRNPQNSPQNLAPNLPPSQARVDLEHSYRKPEDEAEGEGGTGEATPAEVPLQLLLYECGECLQLFQSPKDFLEHQVSHLAPSTPVTATTPAITTPTPVITTTPEPDLHCHQCNELLPSPRLLRAHLLCHTLGRFQCPLCPQVCPDPAQLRRHRAGHARDSLYLCLECGHALDTEGALLSHRRAHGAEPLHRCDTCGKSFVSFTKFLYHRRSHNSTNPSINLPEVVTAATPSPEEVEQVEKEEQVGCSTCGKVLGSPGALARHLRVVHRPERRHRCLTCGKAFKKASHLRNHARTHTGEWQPRPHR